MNKIIVNQIKENNNQELDINIDVVSEISNDIYRIVNHKYILKMLDFDFYYVGNSWLPSTIESLGDYSIYINKFDSIDNIENLYTNIYDGIKINDAVIIYIKNLEHHFIARLELGKMYLGKAESGLHSYFIKLLEFYQKIFSRNVICNIYWLDTAFQGVSFPSVIILNKAYLQKPKTYIYKFLPHEVFHQTNGCHIKFVGKAKEWMRESFVEYLQLIFLKESINSKFFKDQLDRYKELEVKWNNCGLSICDFEFTEHLQQYNQVIYGRGVIVFYEIFGENIINLRGFMQLLYSINGNIDIETYISIIEKVSGTKKELVMHKLNMRLLQ